ncbi:MAG TPA: hypothetical protein PKN22_11355, partial [Taishania sp.]|nr:hypothetical protein [Taishania sp.]
PAFQAMLTTALAVVSEPDEKIMLVTGLPLVSYKQSREDFKKFLLDFTAEVEIEGDIKNIKVKDVYVFPQAAGIFLNPACEEFKQDMATIKALQQETGITPEKLMDNQEYLIKMGGLLPKQQRNEVESSFSRM